jgi:hypothetical protein
MCDVCACGWGLYICIRVCICLFIHDGGAYEYDLCENMHDYEYMCERVMGMHVYLYACGYF